MKARGKSSILENRTFHNREFEDKKKLVELRERKAVKISLAFPTLNEEATIGKEVLVLKTELMERYPLIDEIVVIDSGSHDKTRAVAEEFGAKVYRSDRILPRYGSFRGKGENLWKSLFVLTGDIIVWIDADIAFIPPPSPASSSSPHTALQGGEAGEIRSEWRGCLSTPPLRLCPPS